MKTTSCTSRRLLATLKSLNWTKSKGKTLDLCGKNKKNRANCNSSAHLRALLLLSLSASHAYRIQSQCGASHSPLQAETNMLSQLPKFGPQSFHRVHKQIFSYRRGNSVLWQQTQHFLDLKLPCAQLLITHWLRSERWLTSSWRTRKWLLQVFWLNNALHRPTFGWGTFK